MGETEGPASILRLKEGQNPSSSWGWKEPSPEEPQSGLGAARWKPRGLQPCRELFHAHTWRGERGWKKPFWFGSLALVTLRSPGEVLVSASPGQKHQLAKTGREGIPGSVTLGSTAWRFAGEQTQKLVNGTCSKLAGLLIWLQLPKQRHQPFLPALDGRKELSQKVQQVILGKADLSQPAPQTKGPRFGALR